MFNLWIYNTDLVGVWWALVIDGHQLESFDQHVVRLASFFAGNAERLADMHPLPTVVEDPLKQNLETLLGCLTNNVRFLRHE